MDTIQIPVASLAEVFGLQPDQFLAQFNDDPENPQDITPEIVAAKFPDVIKQERQRFLEEGKKAGARERMTAFEAAIRQKYQVQAKAQGEGLIDALVSDYTGKLATLTTELEALKKSGKKDGMTEDEAKAFIVNHPYFNQAIQEKEQVLEQVRNEFENYKVEQQQRVVMDHVAKAAETALNDFSPVESDDEAIKKNLRGVFRQAVLSGAKFSVKEDGTIQPLDANGEALKDENFRILTFEQYAARVARNFYKQHPADPSKGSPDKKPGAGGAGVEIPDWSKMTHDQIQDRVLSETDPAKRQVLLNSAQQFLG